MPGRAPPSTTILFWSKVILTKGHKSKWVDKNENAYNMTLVVGSGGYGGTLKKQKKNTTHDHFKWI